MRDIWFGQLRHFLNSLGASLATMGYIGERDVEVLTGGVLVIASAIASYYDKRKRKDV